MECNEAVGPGTSQEIERTKASKWNQKELGREDGGGIMGSGGQEEEEERRRSK